MAGLKERFESKFIPESNSGCWLWIGAAINKGYGRIRCSGIPKLAHRVAWELYRGEIPKALCVLHRCDTKLCVRPDHLFLGTVRDNNLDMVEKGRAMMSHCGERNGSAKLTANQVRQIRGAAGTQRSIGKQFGVHQTAISKIRNNQRWK
jgi:hypothetical protein